MSSKVIVAISGGVDSSVTAFLLKQGGYDVEGVTFLLHNDNDKEAEKGSFNCSLTSLKVAQKSAHALGIKHSIIDLRKEFSQKVIEPFICAYAIGQTPNPCIQCNRHIKFPNLIKIADERGADFIATGHYAKLKIINSSPILMKAIDIKKDQSYFLYAVDSNILRRVLLPLGDKTKDEVKKLASLFDISSIESKESQEICFIKNKRYYDFLKNSIDPKEGPIVDAHTKKILGYHKGIHLYTIGQRRKLEIAKNEPRYVVQIDISQNAIYIGRKELAMFNSMIVDNLNWLTPQTDFFRATIKIRSTMKDEPGFVEIIDKKRARVVFDRPQWAPAPGQSAVFYRGDVLVGGGIIVSSSSKLPSSCV
ncbi:MAG: tRNA 2-thiouridine(34) synthase MnmA [Thermodesulfovibrionales bacterium]|nr:tRNA 2-thiouridine(34) synthase MnmA [Thermodesulfovibrionales bacterium]